MQPDVSIYKPLCFWKPVKANEDTFHWWISFTNQGTDSASGRCERDRLASSLVSPRFSSLWIGRFNKLNFLLRKEHCFLVNLRSLWVKEGKIIKLSKRRLRTWNFIWLVFLISEIFKRKEKSSYSLFPVWII